MNRNGRDAHLEFEYPRSRTGVRLAVIADPHVTPTHSGTWKVLHRTEQRLAAALSAAERLNVDAILIPGDLTRGGTPVEFDAVDKFVSANSLPVLAVPGNHDRSSLRGTDTPSLDSIIGPSTTPFHHTVGDVDVLGLNSVSASTGTNGGFVPDDQLQWLTDALDSADRPVVMTHYPLGIDWTGLDTLFPPETFHVANASAVCERLAGTDALVVAGHVHWPIAEQSGSLREIIAPPTCSYPQAICVLQITDVGTTVEMHTISAESDRQEALAHLRADPVLDGTYVDMAERGGPVPNTWVRNVDEE